MALYANIEALCRKSGITIGRLETACGLGNATVRGWGKRNITPSVATLAKVADYFGCTIDRLLREEDEDEENSGDP